MKILIVPMLVTTLLVGAGCRQEGEHAHGAGEAAHGDQGHGAELPSRAITRFTAKSELFAEHRLLVAGQETRFAAHLTDLRDWTPVSEGVLEAILTDSTGNRQVFTIEGVARPGIFQPVVKPQAAGSYQLEFRLRSPKLNDTIPAGDVTVYPDAASAIAAAPAEGDDPEEIAFLKEQQWKIPFATRPIAQGTLAASTSFPGVVKPALGREAAITAPTAGRLTIDRRQLRPPGTRVRQGEVLAILSPANAAGLDRAALGQAASTAETRLRQARLELSRAERLFADQLVSKKRVEEARAALAIAEAEVGAARKRLSAKEAELAGAGRVAGESYTLRAPIAGTVVEAAVVPGAFVEAGSTLYRLVDLSTVWVEARVPEAELNKVARARSAEVLLPGGSSARGTLVNVGSVLDPATRSAPAVFAVANPKGDFRVGMSADVRALTGTTHGLVLPKSAVVDDNGRPIAYVQTGGESFERRELKLGVKQGDRMQVLSGINAGERVVTEGGYEIRLSTLSDAVPAHGHAH